MANRITLSDGTVITGFTVNGTMLEFDSAVDTSVYEGKMSPLVIESDEYNATFSNAVAYVNPSLPNAICFWEQPLEEILQRKINALQAYVEMIS